MKLSEHTGTQALNIIKRYIRVSNFKKGVRGLRMHFLKNCTLTFCLFFELEG